MTDRAETRVVDQGFTIDWGVDLAIRIDVDEAGNVRWIGPRPLGAEPRPWASPVPLVEVSVDDEGRADISPGMQHRALACTSRLAYQGHELSEEDGLTSLSISQVDPRTNLRVTSRLTHRPGLATITAWTEVRNEGSADVHLEFVSSFVQSGLGRADGSGGTTVWRAANCWTAESRWLGQGLEAIGIVDVGTMRDAANTTSRGRYSVTGLGSRSSTEFLPMGILHDPGQGITFAWQVEHNGPWIWEISDQEADLVLVASGPTDREHHWRETLSPGETFESVKVSVAVAQGGLEEAIAAITSHRRIVRRPNADNVRLPVIFNDYMNCLMGDPSSEKLLPLIDAAAHVGCEYFVIDAGWYADDAGWWDDVGEWQPSRRRFPEGLGWLIDRITSAGMSPGLWLEPEVVGIRSSLVTRLPESAFFQRGGRRVIDNGRYHLDFRDAAVRRHLDDVVDRLVREYGVGYLKLDYNIDVAPGTDSDADSPGAGLLGHERSFLGWLDGLFLRHPELVIENCASGGMRADQAQLSRLSIHSTSDQRDYLLYPPIAVSSPVAIPPEQAAVWAYPQPDFTDDAIAFTMITAMLGRIHLSGRIDRMDERQLGLVKSAIDEYKSYRDMIPNGRAHWPLGLPSWYDASMALALELSRETLVAIWRRDRAAEPIRFELPWIPDERWRISSIHPAGASDVRWDPKTRRLEVGLSDGQARLIRIQPSSPTERGS